MLDAKIKQLKKDGKTLLINHLSSKKTWKSSKTVKFFHLPSPSLLRNVWFHIPLYWCRRGFEGQRRLKKSSFVFGEDANGGVFATMSHDETTKKHPGGVSDVESYEKNGRMYKTNSPADGYSALELFLSKLNPQCEALFQYPKRNWRPSDKIWYENRPLGINKLGYHQLRRRSVPCLHKPFRKGDSNNLVVDCGLDKQRNHGHIRSPQRIQPEKLPQHAVGKSAS